MTPESASRLDIHVIIAGVVILAAGVILGVIALRIFKKVRELLAATEKSESELEKKVDTKTREISVLHELTNLISQSLKTDEILGTALGKVMEITGSDTGGIHLIGDNGNFLDLVVSDKLPAELSLHLKRMKRGDGVADIAMQRRTVIGFEIDKYPQSETGIIIRRHGFRYVLCIPVTFKDIPLGVITVAYRNMRILNEEEDTLLRSIGMAIGVALNNAMLFEKVVNAKKEWESTFDTIEDLVYIHDKDCRIIRCNAALMHYVKSKPRDILGKKYFEVFPRGGNPTDGCLREMTRKERTQEEITDKKTGRTFLLDMYPVFNNRTEYIYSVHSSKDITEIKQAKVDLEDLLINTITSLVSAIDAKSSWTKGHSERVTHYSTKIAREFGFDEKNIETLTLAGLLHDIGKLSTYDSILDKADRLTDEEFELIKKHPIKGSEIIAPIKQLSDIIPVVRHHHERYDGKGYPDRLCGEEIPLRARILCVADSFDAMTADRPYRKALGIEEAKTQIKKCSGTQFDPQVAGVFLKILEQ